MHDSSCPRGENQDRPGDPGAKILLTSGTLGQATRIRLNRAYVRYLAAPPRCVPFSVPFRPHFYPQDSFS